MKIKALMVSTFLFLLFSLSGTAYALTVDIDAYPNAPISVTLEAGYYEATPFAGTFTAWNAWGKVDGDPAQYPLPMGQRPPVGWVNSYWINDTKYSDDMIYYTAQDALDNAITAYFTLATQDTLTFQIMDTFTSDNLGGISLDVKKVNAPVPEPATIFLLGTGIVGLVGFGRKKFRKQ